MAYFDHDYVSNSDLKAIMHRHLQKPENENLQAIFDAGTLNHNVLLEPHKADKNHVGYKLASDMAKTVLSDKTCRDLIMMPDFKREYEFYRANMFGLKGVRCKADGYSKQMSAIFEYKGLSITTENGFDNAIANLDYDQSAFFYLNIVKCEYYLIAGVSKKDPRKLFKRLITKEHPYYFSGERKVHASVNVWKQYGFV